MATVQDNALVMQADIDRLVANDSLRLPKSCKSRDEAQCRHWCSHYKLAWGAFPFFAGDLQAVQCTHQCQLAAGHSDGVPHACIECELAAVVGDRIQRPLVRLDRIHLLPWLIEHQREINWQTAIEQNIDEELASAVLNPAPEETFADVSGGTSATSPCARSAAPVASASVAPDEPADQKLTPAQVQMMEANRQRALQIKRERESAPYGRR